MSLANLPHMPHGTFYSGGGKIRGTCRKGLARSPASRRSQMHMCLMDSGAIPMCVCEREKEII